MNRKIVLISVLLLSFCIGCSGEKSSDKSKKAHGVRSDKTSAAKTKKVEVSEEIKNTWKEAKIFLKNKNTGGGNVYTIPLHSELDIPNTELNIEVGAFIPDFKMGKESITSKSKELNNPALQVKVSENGKVVYTGWLFSKFPDMHKFEHPKYSLSLAEETFEN